MTDDALARLRGRMDAARQAMQRVRAFIADLAHWEECPRASEEHYDHTVDCDAEACHGACWQRVACECYVARTLVDVDAALAALEACDAPRP